MKKYRLKQDYNTMCVHVPAGAEATENNGFLSFVIGNDGFMVSVDYAGQRPDWFEEVKEERDPYTRVIALVHGTGGSPKHQSIALSKEFVVIPRKDTELLETKVSFTTPHSVKVSYPKGLQGSWEHANGVWTLVLYPL